MAKMVNEVLGAIKGENKVNETLTGKGAFSKQGFGDLVNAFANDTTFMVPTYDKDGKKNGEISISELIRNDLKKTLENAKYPQKSEAGVLDNAEICTKGLAEAIPHIIMEQMKCGKKLDLPVQPRTVGSIFLADVPAKDKTVQVRDMQTKEVTGTSDVHTDPYIQVRAKSPAPAHLTKKVRKDVNGKVIK